MSAFFLTPKMPNLSTHGSESHQAAPMTATSCQRPSYKPLGYVLADWLLRKGDAIVHPLCNIVIWLCVVIVVHRVPLLTVLTTACAMVHSTATLFPASKSPWLKEVLSYPKLMETMVTKVPTWPAPVLLRLERCKRHCERCV